MRQKMPLIFACHLQPTPPLRRLPPTLAAPSSIYLRLSRRVRRRRRHQRRCFWYKCERRRVDFEGGTFESLFYKDRDLDLIEAAWIRNIRLEKKFGKRCSDLQPEREPEEDSSSD